MGCAWFFPGTAAAAGSITIGHASSDWVSGTFTATMVARPGNRDTRAKTIQGQFELSLRERTIC